MNDTKRLDYIAALILLLGMSFVYLFYLSRLMNYSEEPSILESLLFFSSPFIGIVTIIICVCLIAKSSADKERYSR